MMLALLIGGLVAALACHGILAAILSGSGWRTGIRKGNQE